MKIFIDFIKVWLPKIKSELKELFQITIGTLLFLSAWIGLLSLISKWEQVDILIKEDIFRTILIGILVTILVAIRDPGIEIKYLEKSAEEREKYIQYRKEDKKRYEEWKRRNDN